LIARDLINELILPLDPKNSAIDGLNRMDEYRISSLPIVENENYLGMLDEDEIFSKANFDLPISEFQLQNEEIIIDESIHLFEVVQIAVENEIEAIPVKDLNSKYLGVITLLDTVSAFANITSAQIPGAILVLSMDAKDYSLTEISRLAEGEKFKITGSFLMADPKDPKKVKVTLKLNKMEIDRLISTYERFGYHIISKFQELVSKDVSKERLDILLKYLEM
jgi:acetoin utilization protein AcuB